MQDRVPRNTGKTTPTFCFIRQIQHVSIITCLDGDHIIILRTLQHFRQTGQVDTQRHWSITSILPETNRVQFDRHKSDVRVVHGLEVDAFFIAFEVGVCY